MFSLSGSSGSMLAGKRRCPICGTKRMSYRHDGRLMCKHGHEQAGVMEVESEGVIEGSTRRHTKRVKRDSKKQQERDRRMYGRNAHLLVLQAMQHIIKLQATMLVQNHGVPESLIGAVRALWLLYVSKIEHSGEDAGDLTVDADPGSAGSSQATQSQDMANDTSLDFLLKKVDEDIARDEVEMSVWNQEQGLDTPELTRADTDTGYDTDAPPTPTRPKRGRVKKADRIYHSPGLKLLEEFVRLEYLPAIIYLALLWQQIPVSLADLYYLMADERIPYVSAYQYVPLEISSRMGEGVMSVLHNPHAPSVLRMQRTCSDFELFYKKHHDIVFPMPDAPLVLLSILKRLDLSIELYPMVMRVLQIAGKDSASETYNRTMHLCLTAALVVCLKLHYGLDEIERVSRPSTNELDLPPLREFLSKWRADWVSELSIGAIPFLTAFGGHWETEFVEYYERFTRRPEVPKYKSEFRVLGAKYNVFLDKVAETCGRNAQLADQLLPPSMARQLQSGSEQQAEPVRNVSELGKLIDPLNNQTPRSDSQDQSHLSSIVEPFDHVELPMHRGECYAEFVNRLYLGSSPGYMVPTLGLVLARCSMMLGCSQDKLLSQVTSIESKLCKEATRMPT
ncbi:hypothetical protein LPJ77_000467 [Coemansia sp. RSA 2523]|nr:hypothetical protein LPJ77_000467 [Coemansia sp. RSA 2523]KAJ2205664.1 hypothetical protein IW145_002651 [Coemansia sp. RSA 521]KAJ2279325.1 hypothetical protein GGH14_002813 [Coemansia sp. RSA 370]KAJ2297584.1 hypothetical protein IW139_002758 [Coemansia sp. RSA 353]